MAKMFNCLMAQLLNVSMPQNHKSDILVYFPLRKNV